MGAPKTRTQLRQVYEIDGGQIEVKITSEETMTAESLRDFGSVATACDEFAKARPPKPADVRKFPRGAKTIAATSGEGA